MMLNEEAHEDDEDDEDDERVESICVRKELALQYYIVTLHCWENSQSEIEQGKSTRYKHCRIDKQYIYYIAYRGNRRSIV